MIGIRKQTEWYTTRARQLDVFILTVRGPRIKVKITIFDMFTNSCMQLQKAFSAIGEEIRKINLQGNK